MSSFFPKKSDALQAKNHQDDSSIVDFLSSGQHYIADAIHLIAMLLLIVLANKLADLSFSNLDQTNASGSFSPN